MANTDKLAVFLKEARRSGIEVRPPHVNASEADFTVKDGAIVYALGAVKNVGEAAMRVIAAERRAHGPFNDIHDFAERVDLRAIGKRAVENLARAGALDGLHRSRGELVAGADLLIRYSAQAFDERSSAQGGLFDLAASPQLERPRLPLVEDWPPMERLNEERAALGFYFSGHPLDDYAVELRRLKASTSAEAIETVKSGERFSGKIAAVIRTVRMRRSKSGRPFAFVECSDNAGEFEVAVFSDVLSAARDLFEPGMLVLLTLNAEDRDGEVRFACDAARRLDAAARETTSQLRIVVGTGEGLDAVRRRLAAVKPAAASEAGDVVIALNLPDAGGREVELLLKTRAACTPAMRGALKAVDGVLDVELV
jgi:DNA polymerase-3 subunit alpha